MRNWAVGIVGQQVLVVVVVLLTATSVGVLLASRHAARPGAPGPSAVKPNSPGPGVNPKAEFSFQLSAPSRTVVWALYDPDKLYRSTDGGITWELRAMPSPFGEHPMVTFINDREGWWSAPSPATPDCNVQLIDLWHTTDGAVSWQNLGERIDKTQCKDGIWFIDSTHGFVSAWSESLQPSVYYTSDAGDHWRAAMLPDPADFKTMPGGFSLRVQWLKQFGGALYLLAYGRQGAGSPYPSVPERQYVYRSVDGGASWSVVTKVASRSVVMVTETRWLDLVGGGRSMESTNGGQQFHPFPTNYDGGASVQSQIVFANSEEGYASGPGYLQLTVDGGSTWKRLAPPGGAVAAPPSPAPTPVPAPKEVRLSAPSPDVIWALVGTQSLFRSTDQGATWQQKNLPVGNFFSDVSFVDESDGWVLIGGVGGTQCQGAGAAVWQTMDAGANWRLVSKVDLQTASAARTGPGPMSLDQCKENLSFIDKQRGFVDAWDPNSAPSIYRTSDGGVTWSRSPLPDPPGFHTLAGGDALRAGVVRSFGATLLVEASGMQPDGAHSYVFESADGGATWDFAAGVPPTSANDVAFATATRWLRVGNDGSGQETIDSGKTWHSSTGDYLGDPNVPSFFVFVDGDVGYGTVNGVVRRTADGGTHWSLIKTSWS